MHNVDVIMYFMPVCPSISKDASEIVGILLKFCTGNINYNLTF